MRVVRTWPARTHRSSRGRSEVAADATRDEAVSRQDFVGFGNQIGWQCQTKSRRRLLIQMQLIRLRMLHRDIARLLTFENLIRHARAPIRYWSR